MLRFWTLLLAKCFPLKIRIPSGKEDPKALDSLRFSFEFLYEFPYEFSYIQILSYILLYTRFIRMNLMISLLNSLWAFFELSDLTGKSY